MMLPDILQLYNNQICHGGFLDVTKKKVYMVCIISHDILTNELIELVYKDESATFYHTWLYIFTSIIISIADNEKTTMIYTIVSKFNQPNMNQNNIISKVLTVALTLTVAERHWT